MSYECEIAHFKLKHPLCRIFGKSIDRAIRYGISCGLLRAAHVLEASCNEIDDVRADQLRREAGQVFIEK